jgi:hypothetical protein
MDDEADGVERVDATLEEVTAQTEAVLRRTPRPGQEVRRLVLRDSRDDQGSQYEVAVLEADGTLRVLGHDQGPRVSAAFGPAITSYEWVYAVPPSRVANLRRAMGGAGDDDVLGLLAASYHQSQGILSTLLRHPEVAAEFSNWHR